MNIAESLKNCPEGTQLWSPVCGDCTLMGMVSLSKYPIRVTSAIGTQTFTEEGHLISSEVGECLLFPSKENRDWTKFNLSNYRPGDFVYVRTIADNTWICPFKERKVDRDARIYTFFSYDPEGRRFYGIYGPTSNQNFCTEKDIRYSRLATEQEKVEVLQALNKEGYSWDAENLKLVKKAYEFKPFDKVLVRDVDSQEWRADIFSHESDRVLSELYPYTAVGAAWKQCIPYEGNEHLLGTNNDPD